MLHMNITDGNIVNIYLFIYSLAASRFKIVFVTYTELLHSEMFI